MHRVYKTFIRGLLTILPLALTIALLVWLADKLEAIFGDLLRGVIPEEYYYPVIGVLAGLLLIFLTGLLLQAWVVRKLWTWGEAAVFERLPLVREIYGSLKQLVQYVSGEQQPRDTQVVMVSLGASAPRLLGLLTRDDLSEAPAGMGDADRVAVYLPWSYQVGGFTVYVPRAAVEPVDMTAAEALRWTITAGVAGTSPQNGNS